MFKPALLALIPLLLLVTAIPLYGSSEDEIEFAIQNPFLRERFRERELRFEFKVPAASQISRRSAWDSDGGNFMLERRIDQIMRVFLKKVKSQEEELRSSLETAIQSARQAQLAASSGEKEAGDRLRDSLKELANRAKDLRSTLASVLSELPGKADFEPKTSDLQQEMESLRVLAEASLTGVDEFFFRPGATVSVSVLQGDDMMVSLYKVEKSAEKLSASIAR